MQLKLVSARRAAAVAARQAVSQTEADSQQHRRQTTQHTQHAAKRQQHQQTIPGRPMYLAII